MPRSAGHLFVVGEGYRDRLGEFTVKNIENNKITIEYDNGTRAIRDIEILERVCRNVLIEQRGMHPFQSNDYFRLVGYLAAHADFQAEVPPQSQRGFEEQYLLVTGTRPTEHSQGYYPIQIVTVWDKWGAELRIYFPQTNVIFDLPPRVEIRSGSAPGILRINNNQFWWQLVRVGFRLGKVHDIDSLRRTIPPQYLDNFENGLRLP
jgi:hypothetical protein